MTDKTIWTTEEIIEWYNNTEIHKVDWLEKAEFIKKKWILSEEVIKMEDVNFDAGYKRGFNFATEEARKKVQELKEKILFMTKN